MDAHQIVQSDYQFLSLPPGMRVVERMEDGDKLPIWHAAAVEDRSECDVVFLKVVVRWH